jgi:hypothetical protein
MSRIIPVIVLVVIGLLFYPSVSKAEESLDGFPAPTPKGAQLTFAKTEVNGLKQRFEEHRLDPENVKLSDYDLRYFGQKKLPAEFKDAVSEKEWEEITAETALVVWLKQDVYASADNVQGFIFVDHQGSYKIENAVVKWKAIEKSTGNELAAGTTENLSLLPESLGQVCEIKFDLAKAGIKSVPAEFVVEAVLEFSSEEKNKDCPFSTHQTAQILNSGHSAKNLIGGVYGGLGGGEDEEFRPFLGLFRRR